MRLRDFAPTRVRRAGISAGRFGRAAEKTLCVFLALLLAACGATRRGKGYGVFIGASELAGLDGYETVVIDAQYFSKEQLGALQSGGTAVYSYLNVGSLEDFRDYYDAYKGLALDAYEHWDGECWIDASDPAWGRFVTGTLVPALLEKGVDGFFVDNCDVYARYPSQRMLDALADILRALVKTGKAVLLNGGDVFLDAYCAGGGQWPDILTGVNQEGVFTAVRWDTGELVPAPAEQRAYFTDYVERCAARGLDVYLLEYTRDRALSDEIEAYCAQRGFGCCIAGSLALE